MELPRRGGSDRRAPTAITAPQINSPDRRACNVSLYIDDTPPTVAGLFTRLLAVTDDIDRLWQDALDSQDFDLANVAIDVSNGIHRALLALEHDGAFQ